jgi:hypothetical protein
MTCERCGTNTRINYGKGQAVLCQGCSDSNDGKEMLVNSSEIDANTQSDEGKHFNDLNSKEMLKKWGESIESSFAWLIFFGFFIWLIIVAFADNFKVSDTKRSKLTGAMQAVRSETVKSFAGAEVRLEPRFAENLRLYISRDHFENVPFPDRSELVARIGKAWCSNIQRKYFLPGLSVHDIRNADKLSSYNCILPQLW